MSSGIPWPAQRGTNLVQGKDSDMSKLRLARPRQGSSLQSEKLWACRAVTRTSRLRHGWQATVERLVT